tara:strand:- start:1267 stop:1716 length:450 start_codon:yes stop_codon:yes gene_type:complete
VEDKANFVTSAKNGIVTVLYAYFPFGDIVACVKRETEHVNTSCALNAAAWSEVNPFFALNTITMMLLSSVVYKYMCVFYMYLLRFFFFFFFFFIRFVYKCVVVEMFVLSASGVCSSVCQNSKLHSKTIACTFFRQNFFSCFCHHHHHIT